jgi:MATE family multidrug resistance protein
MHQINRDILKLAVPSILANITVPIVGMVDIAVAGHLDASAATLIGGIAVGSMLFDLLYWNFGFLRVGTGGLTAQAFGRKDWRECARILTRALGMSLAIACCLLLIQWVFVKAAFLVVDCSPEVQDLASEYFFIRIWAAPATLSLMALKGWFIGMQDSVSPMVTDFVVNGMNILMSISLALGIVLPAMGFPGIALGTVVAQYSGLMVALLIIAFKYRRKVFADMALADMRGVFKGGETRRFFVMNADLFVRSLCFIAIYIGFTVISARYGDLLLAVSSIMMKILMIFSYFTDGFAYAGEAMTGRYIGAGDAVNLRKTVRWTFIWSMGLALLFIAIYHFGGVCLLKMMTSDAAVVEASKDFLPWLILMPVVGCAAFTWDGIFIGATGSREMRNSMLWSVVAFAAVWFIGITLLSALSPVAASDTAAGATRHGIIAMHILMAAYFAHLLARTIYLTLKSRTILRLLK